MLEPKLKKAQSHRTIATSAMVLATILVTLGDILMSQAMRKLGPLTLPSLESWVKGKLAVGQLLTELPPELYSLLWTIFASVKVWVAISCMLGFLALWMFALSWEDLTFVMPLTALTYVLNALLAGPALGEHLSATRWVGTILITAGVAIITTDKSGFDKGES